MLVLMVLCLWRLWGGRCHSRGRIRNQFQIGRSETGLVVWQFMDGRVMGMMR